MNGKKSSVKSLQILFDEYGWHILCPILMYNKFLLLLVPILTFSIIERIVKFLYESWEQNFLILPTAISDRGIKVLQT